MNEKPVTPKPVYIISDNPEENVMAFGFEAYARTICDVAANRDNKTPLVIGVYGKWGAGKTSLMKYVKGILDRHGKGEGDSEVPDKSLYRKCKTVWFQAWKYDNENEILAALIEEIFKAMERDGFFTRFKGEFEKLTKTLDKSKIFGKLSELFFAGLNITDFFKDLEYKDKLGFYDTFNTFFDDCLWTYLNWRPKTTKDEIHDDRNGALVVFIDDLDRCPRPRIVKVLETIKLFMDKEGCIFIIGADSAIVESALKDGYGDDARRFMDKIVQVTFNLPRIPEEDFRDYIRPFAEKGWNGIADHLDILVPAMNHNTRELKRFMNNISLLQGLMRNRGMEAETKNLVLWGIIDYKYPELKQDISDNVGIFKLLRNKLLEIGEKTDDPVLWNISEEKLASFPAGLSKYLKNREIARIILEFSTEEKHLVELVTMSSVIKAQNREHAQKTRSGALEWDVMADVPAGPFLYGDEKREIVIEKPYKIDVYPVTNEQYKRFVDAGGYDDKTHWSANGWNWKTTASRSKPINFDDERYNKSDHPVVGVSYYEAEAYAKWAGKRLPTEEEWERAARGTDGRIYPWGNAFDEKKCNSASSGIGSTTRVNRYHDGVSPAGCYDMAGNVWEWTSSCYDNTRIVSRGGAWDLLDEEYFRCAYRQYHFPVVKRGSLLFGFRCAKT
jgi:formylglycine-generating enzyme required for sulfatase activity